jgi:type I restriction enzyme S subunit
MRQRNNAEEQIEYMKIEKESWKCIPFEEAVDICDSQRKPINNKERSRRIEGKRLDELFPYYGATGQVGFIDDYITDGEYVLLGEDGAPFLNSFAKKAYIISGKTWVNNHAHVLRSKTNNRFLCYYLNYFNYKGYVSGTTRLKLTQTEMRRIPIPNPPISEQERIVARIEELFSELDKAIETLKTTKEQLAVYRQAVLKEAFESGLKENPTMFSIERLIVTDRKGMSTGPFGTMIKKYEHQSFGVPMLGIENIDNGKFVDGNKIFVTEEKAKELKSFTLHAGDIIISRSGTVGEICVVPQRAEGSLLSTNLMRVSLDSSKIRSDYFVYLFQSKGIVLDQVKELCKGSTRVFLNQTILKQINFPIPSLDIQRHIVQQIESRLSVCDSIEQTVDTALQQAEAMRQSILKQAFEGRLV